jgi:hypothetical protein
VLDFNLVLSQYDVWTAGIVQSGTGAGVFTTDHSCTTPAVSTSSTNPTRFRNGAYIGDGGGDTLDRTNEGYFEILEMGAIAGGSSLEASVTHSSDLSSPNASKPACTGLPVTDTFPSALVSPSGGMMGTASLINVNDGTDMSYDAVALDGWSSIPNWSGPGSVLPRLSDATPAVSVVIDNTATGGRAIRTNWAGSGRDAVSATMMRSHVYNEYTVEPNIKAATDWVVTMPTKRFYVSPGSGAAARPFQSNFGSTGSCDTINLIYYDREEQSPGAIIDFSPTTPDSRSLCWEANVLTFTAKGGSAAVSNVLGSKNEANVALTANFINGWADLSFPQSGTVHTLPAPGGSTTIIDINTGTVSAATTVTYYGLPVIGFAVQSYTNGTLPVGGSTVLSNYGGNFNHKYMRNIVTSETGVVGLAN